MIDLPSFKMAYISRRPFADGQVTTPFPESDPANIAYLLHGDYFSFFTLKKLPQSQLKNKLASYDLIFLAMDHRDLDTVAHIAAACDNRLVTYSEGNVADYQMHTPSGQATFLQIINQARMNFLYWEKYVPFYRSLTDKPVHYLPYPYFYEEAGPYTVPVEQRQQHATLPSGLAGHTRNGLGSLAVARQLLRQDCIAQINCWLSPVNFAEDARAVQYFLLGLMLPQPRPQFNWRDWLQKSGLDYRFLLRLKNKWQRSEESVPPPLVQAEGLALYRRRKWLQYLPEMAKTMLVIDMNTRETVGRNALDCAAVGVPCVSTNRSDMQERLFPDITLDDSWNVEQALALCKHLLRDMPFYQATIERATAALSQFGPAAFTQRFANILKEYPQLLTQ
jgi:hypothetical protein